MGTLNPAQNYDHVCQVVSGYTGMHDLQFVAPAADGADFHRGSLVSLNANGEFQEGLANDHAMPMLAIPDIDDFDANSDVGNISGGAWSAFPCVGGYEFMSTEFDDAETYSPNDLLTGATGADAGKVTLSPVNYNDEEVVGCVSRAVSQSIYQQQVLHFWGMFIPKVAVS